ncbi:Aldose 1-epimerase family protein [Trichomonas vaginalis G3]|uniref:Aldose 1-epimerase n=1 Tax=Trichomonas vaginalis (strain ATCC PRA-98 / G3) TaxID=412133 RepID=A2FH97_TRIV3|nr:galactose mutarotase like domain-containing protein [Trichomonas vaginalis G3]EAX95735.1 Aldose 1-epimerase family protein [Trichomonas vaginalis G3]KAI5549307.1 galactose mutarotase like domain-containing protein [Trichomonas vaginalis G3]|eukprot:XP_001308665.1 Aldose 1-epimerase family protein [Trichomonas vaginalis G3]
MSAKTSSSLNIADYETTHQGKQVKLIVLKNSKGMEVCVSNFGANIVSFVVPDKDGKLRDIVLNQPTIKDIIENSFRFTGATCGRSTNRIAKGHFIIDGNEYTCPINNDINNNHTGVSGFHNNVWDIVEQTANKAVIRYVSVDGADGFPGNLETTLTFTVDEENALRLDFDYKTDKPTVCSITQHSFFNLTQPEDDVFDTDLQVFADFFTPVDDHMTPTGEVLKVAGTVFDFREPMALGKHILDNDDQIIKGTGYDHTFVLRKQWRNQLALAAKAFNKKSGITLEMHTDMPGMQLYTANWMDGFAGKYGTKCDKRHAFCLEAGAIPNSINTNWFPSTTVYPGQPGHNVIVFKAGLL